jgi:hypothetical protein
VLRLKPLGSPSAGLALSGRDHPGSALAGIEPHNIIHISYACCVVPLLIVRCGHTCLQRHERFATRSPQQAGGGTQVTAHALFTVDMMYMKYCMRQRGCAKLAQAWER